MQLNLAAAASSRLSQRPPPVTLPRIRSESVRSSPSSRAARSVTPGPSSACTRRSAFSRRIPMTRRLSSSSIARWRHSRPAWTGSGPRRDGGCTIPASRTPRSTIPSGSRWPAGSPRGFRARVTSPGRRSRTMIGTARVAMATRQRELHAFSYPNADDVLVGDAGRGLRLVFIGIQPDFRLPLEGYYGFLALKNGVPVSYGGGWELFGVLDFAVNIFASFRQGESAYLATQLLRAYRRIFNMRTIVVDRYQLGHESTEALRSGSFYFYHRLGFRPRDPGVIRVLAEERAKIAADLSYRSPIPVLKRLAADEVFLTLPGGLAAPEKRLRATDLSALVPRRTARAVGGDRRLATRPSAARVGRILGATRRAGWPGPEQRSFARMSLVAALIPDLARWPLAERRELVAVMRAKGGASEMGYARRLDAHARLRRSLEALARA